MRDEPDVAPNAPQAKNCLHLTKHWCGAYPFCSDIPLPPDEFVNCLFVVYSSTQTGYTERKSETFFCRRKDTWLING